MLTINKAFMVNFLFFVAASKKSADNERQKGRCKMVFIVFLIEVAAFMLTIYGVMVLIRSLR